MASEANFFQNEKLQDEKFDADKHVIASSVESSGDADVGYDLFMKSEYTTFDVAEEAVLNRKVLWKIDLRVLPIICIVYCLQSMDKSAISYSNLFGFQPSLHLVGQQLNFAGAMVNRFILGCLEAAITPAFILMTGMCLRTTVSPVDMVFLSIMGWDNWFTDRLRGRTYQWNSPKMDYLVLGGITALFSLVVLAFLPDSPVRAVFFTDEERIISIKRVAANKTGIENKHFKWYQVEMALKDPKTYILFVLSLSAQIPNNIIGSFSTQIIQSMGFDVLQTTILGIPSSAIQGAGLVIAGYLASRVKNSRVIIMTVGNVSCIIAAACMAYLPLDNKWGRLVAFWFTGMQSIGFALGLSMVSINMGGCKFLILLYVILRCPSFEFAFEDTKKAFTPPHFEDVIKTAAGLVLGAYMIWENRRRDSIQRSVGPAFDEHEGQRLSLLDKTEFVSRGRVSNAMKIL
ncbi:hypothetical protein Clacol_006046 [Clathrus columnatus]|uniref:Allantoate permease n=1 Tax=Clathrus columnatus TaxID=1419009 RepID=A0AAV5AE68_9AGAM|nr:hypothetical protein Clacol_006046 [Clathrus columnatus]